MAMVFNKFNRLLRSRLLWAGFCIIISVAFVGLFTSVPEQNEQAREARSAGTLNGKSVDAREYRDAYFNTYLSFAIQLGQAFSPSRFEDELRREAWRRLITLRHARELGLEVSEREIVQAIRQQPMFTNEQGQFNPAAYQQFIQQVMGRQFGVSSIGFEQHIEEEILLNRVRNMVSQTILVPPVDQRRAFRTLTDTFTVRTLTLPRTALTNEIVLSEADLEAYFETNKENFEIPGQVVVDVLEVAISNYLGEVELAEDEARTFYDANIDRYITETEPVAEGTNGVADALSGDNSETGDTDFAEFDIGEPMPIQITVPFEDVQADIEKELRLEKAMQRAAEKATDVMVRLTPDRSGRAPSLTEIGQELGLPVTRSAPFSREDGLPGIEAGTEFVEAAFRLEDTPDLSYSDAIVGENNVYLLSLVEKIPAREATLAEVEDDVRMQARFEAQLDALRVYASDVRETLLEGLNAGSSITNLADEIEGLQLSPAQSFTMIDGLDDVPDANIIARLVLAGETGDISEPIDRFPGAFMVYIQDRAPNQTISIDSIRPQIVSNMQRERLGRLFGAFQDHLLETAGFEPREPLEDGDAESEATEAS